MILDFDETMDSQGLKEGPLGARGSMPTILYRGLPHGSTAAANSGSSRLRLYVGNSGNELRSVPLIRLVQKSWPLPYNRMMDSGHLRLAERRCDRTWRDAPTIPTGWIGGESCEIGD
jgi:hypothetical protein